MAVAMKPAPAKSASKVQSGVKRINVTIRGLPPGIIFQGKGVMAADEADGGKKKKQRPPEEEAKLRAHWTGTGASRQLCIPWVMLYQSICAAGGTFKYRGQKTMSTVVAATISCEVDKIPLGTSEYEVYEEYVRIPPRTGVMVSIGRPRIPKWEASFVLVVDDELYAAENLREIIAHAGKLIGIGAWRPQLKGPYGRFEVTEFEIM
jgi:hypothetical protein